MHKRNVVMSTFMQHTATALSLNPHHFVISFSSIPIPLYHVHGFYLSPSSLFGIDVYLQETGGNCYNYHHHYSLNYLLTGTYTDVPKHCGLITNMSLRALEMPDKRRHTCVSLRFAWNSSDRLSKIPSMRSYLCVIWGIWNYIAATSPFKT